MTIDANGNPNAAQFENWNGDNGSRWVASADERDRILAPVADALFAAAALTPGSRILDIGCGCGVTSLRAAELVGTDGSVTGIDISEPMLGVARTRAAAEGARTITFVNADAQTYAFAPDSIDVVIGRFGTMFFANPVAAFINIGGAIAPGGRLALATWQPLIANDWLLVPGTVLLNHTTMPEQPANAPGMFGQSDPSVVKNVLDAAGYTEITLTDTRVTFTLGATVDEALGYLAEAGPARLLLETIPEGTARDAAIADVRTELAHHLTPAGVQLGGGIWLIAARRAVR